MPRSRNRSRDHSLSAMPRLGFLLFILALAIVIWPKLRPSPTMPASSETHSETTPQVEVLNVSQAATVSEQSQSESQSELNSPSTPSQPKSGQSTTIPDSDELIIADGQTRDLLSLVADNTIRMTKREMPAYWELVRRSAKATFPTLRETANTKIKFRDLYNRPSKHRGELVGLDVTIRRVIRYDAEAGNAAGVKNVYEIWGSTDESKLGSTHSSPTRCRTALMKRPLSVESRVCGLLLQADGLSAWQRGTQRKALASASVDWPF